MASATAVSSFAEVTAGFIELVGVGVIAGVGVFTLGYCALRSIQRRPVTQIYSAVRSVLGRGILLGLEFLVAADIIHTVAVELTLKTVAVLALVVLIRTFLSFTLELELTGRWPWQQSH